MQINQIQSRVHFDISALKDAAEGKISNSLPRIQSGSQCLFLYKADLYNEPNLDKYGFDPHTLITFFVSESDLLVAFIQEQGQPVRNVSLEQLATGSYTLLQHFSSEISAYCRHKRISIHEQQVMQFSLIGDLFQNVSLFDSMLADMPALRLQTMHALIRASHLEQGMITTNALENSVVATQRYC